MYRKFSGDVRLLGFTDSAFKAQENEGSGLALRGLAVLLTGEIRDVKVVINVGKTIDVHFLEWLVRRLRRVVRSVSYTHLTLPTKRIV